jgi:hypothetical protein
MVTTRALAAAVMRGPVTYTVDDPRFSTSWPVPWRWRSWRCRWGSTTSTRPNCSAGTTKIVAAVEQSLRLEPAASRVDRYATAVIAVLDLLPDIALAEPVVMQGMVFRKASAVRARWAAVSSDR